MKNKTKKLSCLTALFLCFIMILSLASCSKGKTLLSFTQDKKTYTISENIYELLLSRAKGTLVAGGYTSNGYKASNAKFWDITDTMEGWDEPITLNDYYRASMLDTCKKYLIGLYLFDKNELSLSDATIEEIQDKMNEYVLTDGEGSKTKLNSVLALYGVNYNILKEALTIQAKVEYLQTYYYSILGENIKNDYMNNHYVHFHQIYLSTYNYIYETDEHGDVVYYDSSNNHVVYKTTAYPAFNGDGSKTTDSNGSIIYYTDDTYEHISYDSENGVPAYKMSNDGSAYLTEAMSDEEKNAVKLQAELLESNLIGKSADDFEKEEENDTNDMKPSDSGYTDGYYLQTNVDYSSNGSDSSYLDEIVAWLQSANDGDVKLFVSNNGYHIIRKYACTENAYSATENTVWFEDFETNLSTSYFESQCEQYISQVEVDNDVYASVPSMKEIGINYYY